MTTFRIKPITYQNHKINSLEVNKYVVNFNKHAMQALCAAMAHKILQANTLANQNNYA